MTAVYTWDVFSTLDGYGSFAAGADLGGYWGKQGPELLDHRAALFDTEQRMVFGATTFRETAQIMSSGTDPHSLDEWVVRTTRMPATVISSTLQDTLGWPDATIVRGDAVDIVTRLKEASDVPLRSQASLSLNWALMAAGLVDRLQVTIFPAISGRTGTSPILAGAGDFDLELLESRTLDRHTQELIYRPTPGEAVLRPGRTTREISSPGADGHDRRPEAGGGWVRGCKRPSTSCTSRTPRATPISGQATNPVTPRKRCCCHRDLSPSACGRGRSTVRQADRCL